MSNQIALLVHTSHCGTTSASNDNVFFLHHLPDGYGNIARAYRDVSNDVVCDLKVLITAERKREIFLLVPRESRQSLFLSLQNLPTSEGYCKLKENRDYIEFFRVINVFLLSVKQVTQNDL